MPGVVCSVSATLKSLPNDPMDNIYVENNCTVQFKGVELGTGTFFVTENILCWIRNDRMGFELDYLHVTAHAVSKDLSSYPKPCIYMLYEPTSDDDQDDIEDEDLNIEIRVVPSAESNLNRLYESITDGQLLHPDPNQPDDNDEFDEGEGGLAMSSQIRFDSDGQLLMNENEELSDESGKFEDMDEG